MRIETIGLATLYLGDCREVLPELRAHACVTDPPYGVELAAQLAAAERTAWRWKPTPATLTPTRTTFSRSCRR